MATKKKTPTASKQDLFSIIREFQRVETEAAVATFVENERAANVALQKFRSENTVLKRLEKAVDDTYRKRRNAEQRIRASHHKKLNRLRNLIRLYGPTPKVIAEVAKLAGVSKADAV